MIIFDLDGTLADCEHRRHYVDKSYICCGNECTTKGRCLSCLRKLEKDQPNWEAFYEACDKDTVILPSKWTMRALDYWDVEEGIHIWSGRCESVRGKTEEWLDEHRIYYRSLKMRPIGDYTPDDVLKEMWLDEAIAEGKKIDFVFDDRPKVVRMWRRRGIFVFDCNQQGEEF